MSDSSHTTPAGNKPKTGDLPRAVIHKKILDAAEASPNASIDEVATTVSGASADLVERVLEDYGDPAEATDDPNMIDKTVEPVSNSTSDGLTDPTNNEAKRDGNAPNPQELTDKQRRTLRAIYDHPEATQGEIAEQLDVTNVTVSNRVNEIDGFDWDQRQEFVTHMFGNEKVESNGDIPDDELELRPDTSADLVEKVDALTTQIDSLEQQLSERPAPSEPSVFDPDLAAKLLHACLHSDNITEDEELEIFQSVISITNSGN